MCSGGQKQTLLVEEIPGGLRLKLLCSLEAVDKAVQAVEGFFGNHAETSARFGALLVLREALMNALRHGCGLGSGLSVEARITVEGKQAVIVVTDPGPGFDWRNRSLSLPDSNCTSGRGLCIMRRYASSMSYNDTGNTLTLQVDLEEGTPQ